MRMRNILIAGAALFALMFSPADANQSNTWSPTTGTVSGLQLTTNYNNAFTAIQTCNSGASAPANDQSLAAVKGQCWLNTTSGTLGIVEMYDGSNWTTVGWLDSTNHQWIANNAGGAGTIASNTTTDLGSVINPVMSVSGTTTITSFGTTALQGAIKYINFTGILTLTHNGTSLILPNGGSNIITAVGDTLVAEALGSGNWRVLVYQAASGSALSANANLTTSVAFAGVISPTAIAAGATNNWAPTGLANAETIYVTGNSAGSTITGLTGGAAGRQITLSSISTTGLITLTCNDAGSSVGNRFFCVSPINLYAGGTGSTGVTLRYDSIFGGWRPTSAVNEVAPVVFKNLKIVNDSGAPTTTVDVSADYLTVENAQGMVYRLRNVSVSPVMTSSGVNGLDTGAIVNNSITWYSVIVIYNPGTNTAAGLYSLQASCLSATLPSGYTACARVGWMRTDGAATARWMRSIQYGRRAQYVVTAATNTANIPLLVASGTVGSTTVPTWVAQSVANFVPTTASIANVLLGAAGASASGEMAASNNSYGAANSTSNPPPCMRNGQATGDGGGIQCAIMLETANIYYASGNAAAYLGVLGWEDNL